MPLNWDDDDEEDITELEYRRRPSPTLVHDEVTTAMGDPRDYGVSIPHQKPPHETKEQALGISAPTPYPPPAKAFTPAAPRDRFVAFLIDSLLGFYLYALVGFLLNRFFETATISILHQRTGRFVLHFLLTLTLIFLYYVLMESVFGATLGKFFCRLRVVEENGQSASLGNVFIRNFLRLVDYPLGFLIAVISMESSPLQQRLGDRAAKTIVIKKTRRHLPTVNLAHVPLASTLSRLFAELIDLCLSISLVYGFLLMMRSTHLLLSFVMLVSAPFIFIFYYTFLELFTSTTPGKALFKRQVVMEHGDPLDGTSAFLRNLFRPLDYLLGYPLLVLSKRKQRLGDMAADTLVVVKKGDRRAILGTLSALLLIATLVYLGFSNPKPIFKKDFGIQYLKTILTKIPSTSQKKTHSTNQNTK